MVKKSAKKQKVTFQGRTDFMRSSKQNDDNESNSSQSSSNVIKMKKDIGIVKAVSIVFGVIIGSGIFVSPVGVLRYSKSVGLSLVMWLVTGFFSMMGALVYAELGVRIPKSGGEYTYVMEAFGGFPAFIIMWITFFIIGGVTCAANAIIFSEYILQPLFPTCDIPRSVKILIAITAIMLICAINCYKVSLATRVAVVFSIAKFTALILIIGFGFYHLAMGRVESFESPFEDSTSSLGLLALSFYQGFWAFAGWNYLNFLVEEMERPARNLPLAIGIALALVTALYLFTNIAYLAVLTPTEMLSTGSGSAAIAILFAERAMPWFATVMPILVGASVFGSINGITMAISRLTYSGARNGHLPSIFALIHHQNLTPIPAVLILLVLATGFQFYSDLFSLIELAGFAMSLIAALAVSVLIHLRLKDHFGGVTRDSSKETFRLPLVVPIVFLVCDLFILGFTAYIKPKQCLSNLFLILAAIPFYIFGVMWTNKPAKVLDLFHEGTIMLQKSLACVPVGEVVQSESDLEDEEVITDAPKENQKVEREN